MQSASPRSSRRGRSCNSSGQFILSAGGRAAVPAAFAGRLARRMTVPARDARALRARRPLSTRARDKLPKMSEELSIQGTLAETTVPDLFRSLIRSSETAIVSLEGFGRTDVIYVSEGRVIFASSTDPDTGLGEVLLRSGELNLQQYNQ